MSDQPQPEQTVEEILLDTLDLRVDSGQAYIYDTDEAKAALNRQALATALRLIDENMTHYQRTCNFCGYSWLGLHCVHDGYQNPCGNCDRKPVVIDYFDCNCNEPEAELRQAFKEEYRND